MNRDPQLLLSDAEISLLDDFALCDKLWGLVVEAYYHDHGLTDLENAPCNYPESLFAKDLSFHWWVAYAVHAFQYDVLAGGLAQFFENHAGLTNAETKAALAHIGAHDFVPVFADACAVCDRFSELFRRDPVGTGEEYIQLRDRFSKELSPMWHRLWDLYQSQEPRSYLTTYIRDNLELFRSHKIA
jgi:hypothetical protein